MKSSRHLAFFENPAGKQSCHPLREDDGSSLVELSLLLSFLLLPLVVGISDLAVETYYSIEVTNAAHAGASAGMQNSTLASQTSATSVMSLAATAEAPDIGTSLVVTPTVFYACSTAVNGTRYTGSSAQTNASSACTGSGNRAVEFVQVTTSAAIPAPFPLPGLPSSFTLHGSSVMEVEQ